MSFEEKNTWIYTALAVILPTVYAVIVFSQLQTTPVDEIDYAGPLLTAVFAAIVLSIIGSILIAIASPKEAEKTDERDKNIGRRGDLVGYYVLATGVVGALLLVIGEAQHFWIANAIYGAFVVSAVISSVVKLVAYRRGF